ncbi:hypothetical protein AB8Z38_19445 [Bradyrhizobium sp. LLZ17]|uniref:Uncharacterized protein n=1 Tax=Bradyrhizobium sp. LLZ17 TaxID=3239388 RepID=A0AB39XYA1_9BRAD
MRTVSYSMASPSGFAHGGFGEGAGTAIAWYGNVVNGRQFDWRALMFAVALTAAAAGHAETPPPGPKPAQIDRNGVLMLVRSSLLALDHANKTGNYTVLRDIGAPGFQSNTAARLGEIFAKLRNDNLDLSGVAVIDPQLNLLPQIEANGLMHMAGFFPSVPSQVNFDLAFAPVNGQWRLFGISVSIGQSGPRRPTRLPLRNSTHRQRGPSKLTKMEPGRQQSQRLRPGSRRRRSQPTIRRPNRLELVSGASARRAKHLHWLSST